MGARIVKPSPSGGGRQQGKHGETRQRLIDATIALIHVQGMAGLTTQRITHAAGIAQPGLYAHFKNAEDCMQAALEQVVQAIREKSNAVRKQAFARFLVPPAAGDDPVRAAYAETLDVLLEHRVFAELFLRYRRDPTVLSGFMPRAFSQVRSDTIREVWRLAERVGWPVERKARVAWFAEQLLAMYLAAAEALLDGRVDCEVVLDGLSQTTHAMVRGYMPAASRAPAPAAKRARRKRSV